ncbi:50S ribosomal protein L18 [Clostridium cylindrosporum]|uniref:Large ribosomal subunit protein uL18 n=1 Tax=Clostridium cylindrosporum DSM 605 TaxID=1121307 RepID=A0A0J8DA85_CLOCY|nr:50S ribosomal protein L18 [Clostridium cylindrosporum]KMT21224.1 50S ribosomal protein L18 [Clostridium cylindrosporum DSM 605]
MINKPSKNGQREKRHLRVRKKVTGTAGRPRLNVFRSEKQIYAQIINDVEGKTLVAASSIDKELKGKLALGSNKEAAKVVGELIAKRALESGISDVVFDRGGYIYHGRVKVLAEAAREAGLNF